MPRKRIGTKSNTALRKKAEDGWLLFWVGIDDKVFDNYEEAKDAWQLVRNFYIEGHPFHCQKGKMEYGPAGYWLFEVPGAPFAFPDIPGLENSEAKDYFKRKKLISLRIWPANCYDPMADEAEYIAAAYKEGPDGLPAYIRQQERPAAWKALLAKRAALVKLGYLKR